MERPAPMTPPDVDLRGFEFMPLDTTRLLDSDLFALSSGDEFKAAVALWCKSWHQVPGGSLPADDRVLAHLSGAGARWPKVREIALRGWVECSDGRLYHPLIAEKAVDAWASRVKHEAKREAERKRLQEWREKRRRNAGETRTETAGETRTKLVGEGEGEGYPPKAPPTVVAVSPATPASDSAPTPPDDPAWLPAESWAGYLAMRKAKQRKAPFTPRARALVLAELERLKAQGQDIAAVLDQSVRNGWTDVYALKAPMRANGAPASVIAHPSSATPDEAAMRRISEACGGLAVERLPDGRYRCGVHFFRPDGRREVLA